MTSLRNKDVRFFDYFTKGDDTSLFLIHCPGKINPHTTKKKRDYYLTTIIYFPIYHFSTM